MYSYVLEVYDSAGACYFDEGGCLEQRQPQPQPCTTSCYLAALVCFDDSWTTP